MHMDAWNMHLLYLWKTLDMIRGWRYLTPYCPSKKVTMQDKCVFPNADLFHPLWIPLQLFILSQNLTFYISSSIVPKRHLFPSPNIFPTKIWVKKKRPSDHKPPPWYLRQKSRSKMVSSQGLLIWVLIHQRHGCFLKWWVFPPNHPFEKRFFHYKPFILGYPYFWKPPHVFMPPGKDRWRSPLPMYWWKSWPKTLSHRT